MAKIAINGFGRIGRLFFRYVHNKEAFRNLEIVAVNDLGSLESLAYLLKYDTVYRTYPETVTVEGGERIFTAGGKKISFFQEKDPGLLPWKKLGIDVVVESSGVFESYEKAKTHLTAGAKRVVISAPAKDSDGVSGRTVLVGINENELEEVVLSSNASCTTNAASSVVHVLSKKPGIAKAVLNTVHGYTATQELVDTAAKGKDFRRGRAAAQNIIPSTTGAALAVTRVIPELQGKFDGIAMRVPVAAGSIADITFIAKRKTSVEEVNSVLREAAESSRWQGILTVTDNQIVSSDTIGEPYAAIVDLSFTKVVDGDLVKVLSWYDNEWGYVTTLARHVEYAARLTG